MLLQEGFAGQWCCISSLELLGFTAWGKLLCCCYYQPLLGLMLPTWFRVVLCQADPGFVMDREEQCVLWWGAGSQHAHCSVQGCKAGGTGQKDVLARFTHGLKMLIHPSRRVWGACAQPHGSRREEARWVRSQHGRSSACRLLGSRQCKWLGGLCLLSLSVLLSAFILSLSWLCVYLDRLLTHPWDCPGYVAGARVTGRDS